MNRRKARELMDALLEGEISEADFLALEAQLVVDDELRKEYLQRVTLTTLLEAESADTESADTESANNVTSANGLTSLAEPTSWSRYAAGALLVAALCVMAFSLWPKRDSVTANTNVPAEEEVAGYGVISGQDAVEWSDNIARTTGSLLPTGELQLSTGIVQLELFSGVSVVVEGPAEFSVVSPMHMVVQSGKLRAHVPEPAHGFRVSTRDGEVVDLGTDFAVDVTGNRSELHVLAGEVELRSKDNATRRLVKGQALSLSGGTQSDLLADSKRFVGQNEMVGRLQLAMKSRRDEWLAWSNEFRNDPRLIAFYQPGAQVEPIGENQNNNWSANRRIANRATRSTSAASQGAVVAAARTLDRWHHQEGALDFSPTGSRVRLTVPGEHQSLTLNCWVKINSLDRWYNSLFLTDGHEQHEPHWQIMDDGRLFFSVKKRDEWDASKGEKDKHVYFSPPFWDSSLSGQWLMISTIYDVGRRQVTHYLNGMQISEEAIPDEYLVERVRIGNASLCNWSLPERDEPRFAVRNLNGSLDEFAMFSAALSPEEILEMYEHGKP